MDLTITNITGTYTLKLDNGDGLALAGGKSFTMGLYDMIFLKWLAASHIWLEISRNSREETARIEDSFITTWQTENAGSATKTIVIPTTSYGYDCWIDWGDGSAEEHQTGTPGNITHVYSTAGIKVVKIRGTFPRIYFNNGGDKLKLLTIENWGNIEWSNMYGAFYGCANLKGNYTGYINVPNTTNVTNMKYMFRDCAAFNSPVNFNTSNVTDMSYMF